MRGSFMVLITHIWSLQYPPCTCLYHGHGGTDSSYCAHRNSDRACGLVMPDVSVAPDDVPFTRHSHIHYLVRSSQSLMLHISLISIVAETKAQRGSSTFLRSHSQEQNSGLGGFTLPCSRVASCALCHLTHFLVCVMAMTGRDKVHF